MSRSARCCDSADIADAIVHVVTRPAHVCVNEVVGMGRSRRTEGLAPASSIRLYVITHEQMSVNGHAFGQRLRTLREAMQPAA